ncbi:hypothetical protein ACFQ1Q_13295 [Winogradskyella litorisediminis]|uniref:WD40-like Beta Propeller Repeat n=1 Tax=Winogradskyella litorisediminis TaxID=1156618 RepID=A0ABW3NC38_9FLAO
MFLAFSVSAQNLKVKNVKINNGLNHFAPVMSNGKIYFSQNKLNHRGKPIKTRMNTYVYTLNKANVDTQGEISNVEPVSRTKLGFTNMSVATFTKDGRYMYFTTNSDEIGENRRKEYNTFNLQIHRAEYVEGKGWTNEIELPFLDKEYSFAHPTLSPDEKTLYFVSNYKGAKGRTDIFKVSIFGHKNYGDPERLGDEINSTRTELFPFVSHENKMYFSSNRDGGNGGYDIYSFDLENTDTSQKPVLLPEPINSIGEDFSFYLMEDCNRGFFTSRRRGGKGDDDIYFFTGFQSSKPVLNLAD